MAANSKRERIIENVAQTVHDVNAIVEVQRRQPQYNELSSISHAKMPFAAVVASLPKPFAKKSGRQPAKSDIFHSELKVQVFVYAQDNKEPDVLVSSLADDIWAALYVDESRGGLCDEMDIDPDMDVGYWAPYVAFRMTVVCKYYHNREGI